MSNIEAELDFLHNEAKEIAKVMSEVYTSDYYNTVIYCTFLCIMNLKRIIDDNELTYRYELFKTSITVGKCATIFNMFHDKFTIYLNDERLIDVIKEPNTEYISISHNRINGVDQLLWTNKPVETAKEASLEQRFQRLENEVDQLRKLVKNMNKDVQSLAIDVRGVNDE
jgi:hypothetical protein